MIKLKRFKTDLKIRLKLVFNVLLTKRLHVVEYDGFVLCKIGSNDGSKGVTTLKHEYPSSYKMKNNG